MNWRLSWTVPVILSVILNLGCNSSAKHLRMQEFTKDTELMATLQAPPEQPLGLERPIIPPQHPPITIHPEPHTELRIPIVTLNSNPRSKILTVTPDPNVDYKVAVGTPNPGIDYKMLVVPGQEHIPHTFVRPVPPLRRKPEVPPVPWKPKNRQRNNAK